VTSWVPERIGVDINADRPAMLVVSQSWLPGWTATIDGKTVPVVRADGIVQAVPVPAGAHHVTLNYMAPGLKTGAGITTLTVLVLLGWWVVERRGWRFARKDGRIKPGGENGVSP
jgi:uncharacterized membrane protein YfhO